MIRQEPILRVRREKEKKVKVRGRDEQKRKNNNHESGGRTPSYNNGLHREDPSSETQKQSVVSGERARRKFSSTGERAPGYCLSPNYFQKFKRIPAPDWGQKNALYYCAQSANSFSRVLFVSSYTTAIVLLHLPGSFTKLVRARETFIFYFPNQKRRNHRLVEKTFGMLSAGAI